MIALPLSIRTNFGLNNFLTSNALVLITQRTSPARRCGHERVNLKTVMNDLIFTVTIIAFFVIGGLYVRFCEKL